ncbi:SulP family inorganic anion transporter [Roseateles sp. DB2]|uniref:SulP family inorganic anion transporter n=1 Tax=Roseateles sp. DB2 TaxID=3453717 RepID=UPI003EED1171
MLAYARGHWRDDLVAAAVVSVLLIPQSLAYAVLAGLPAEVGIYASLLPLLAYALLGSSPYLGVGPVAIVALMVAQATAAAPAGYSASQAALVLAAESALLMAAAAALRLDALAALMSVPVLHGFETGATLAIALSQLPALLGSPAQGSELPALISSAADSGWRWHAPTLGFGLAAVLLLLLGRRLLHGLWARLAPLAVLLLTLGMAWLVQARGLGVPLVGELPALHPRLQWPPLDPALWLALLPGALLIALIAYVSSLVVAEALARRRGERVDPRRELMGLAGANLAAAFSAGMPVAGSFSRSALLYEAGSRSRMSSVMAALLMGAAALSLAPALAWLPRSVLAASILVAVLSGLQWRPYLEAWRYARGEGLLMLAVTLLVLNVSVAAALGLGVLGSIALLLQRTARPHVALVGRVPGTEHYRNVDRHEVECLPEVMGLRIDESLLFTNARSLADVVQAQLALHPGTRRVVLQMSPVNSIDYSGLEALRELHESLLRQGVRLDLSELKGPVLDRLRAACWERWFRGQVHLSHHQGMTAGQTQDWISP